MSRVGFALILQIRFYDPHLGLLTRIYTSLWFAYLRLHVTLIEIQIQFIGGFLSPRDDIDMQFGDFFESKTKYFNLMRTPVAHVKNL